MNSISHFLQYHNAVPIALGLVFMGAGATYAATNPESIYSAEQDVLSIDNTYIVNKDLSHYTPSVQIVGVTEDETNYYIAYQFSTIDLAPDFVWKDIAKAEVMTVAKVDLGPYRDLGVYVTQQLKQIIDREISRLKITQDIQRKEVSLKVVATVYGGLVGKLLDDTTEILPGYSPVVLPPAPEPQIAAAAAASGDQQTPTAPGTPAQSGTANLRIQILGNNPAQIPIGSQYNDLGAVATDNKNNNLTVHTLLNGKPVSNIQIETANAGTWTVTYTSADPEGRSASIDRKVYVYDPAVGPPLPEPVFVDPPEPEPQAEPTPAPQSEPVVEDPTPEPEQTQTPEPVPDQKPTPEPTPEPAPEPAPEEVTPPASSPAESESTPAPDTSATESEAPVETSAPAGE